MLGAGQDLADRIGVGFAFLSKHAFGEVVRSVVVMHGAPTLEDNGPMIIFIVDDVNRASGFTIAGRQYGLMNMMPEHALSAMIRQEGGVDIQHASHPPGRDRQKRQEPTHADQGAS